eukprot:scaffold891_cov130-Skeletonema_menzelii.AAC.4
MRTISSGVLGADQESTSTEGGTRKTRISFELHPSVFYEDLFYLPMPMTMPTTPCIVNLTTLVRKMSSKP